MDEDKFEEEYGDEADGFVAKSIKFDTESGKCLMELKAVGLKKVGDSQDMDMVNIGAALFKHILNDKFDLDDIECADVRIMFEVPVKTLQKEWQAVVKNSKGGFFKLSKKEVENEVTQWVPKVVVKGDEKEQRGGEGDD